MPKKVVSLKLDPELLAEVDAAANGNRNGWITEAIKEQLAANPLRHYEPAKDTPVETEPQRSPVDFEQPDLRLPSKPKEFNRLVMVYQMQGKSPKQARDMAQKKIYG